MPECEAHNTIAIMLTYAGTNIILHRLIFIQFFHYSRDRTQLSRKDTSEKAVSSQF